MYRIALHVKYFYRNFTRAAIFIIMLSPSTSYGDNYEVLLKSGVSREVLNYDGDSANLVTRGGVYLNLAETFSFNYTALRNIDAGTSSFTWNTGLKNISGFLDFMSGNYNLHFGSGLMMGKASYRSADPFSKKISLAKERTVTPSNGGNPEYSLYGTVFDFHNIFEDLKIDLIPFYSVQRRYVSIDSSEAGVIDSSLFSLNTKIKRNGNNTEPVNVINCGWMFGLRKSDFFSFQVYFFETDLKGDSGMDILWDGDKGYGGGGIDLIKNSGFFAEYADNNFFLFIEPAMSSIISRDTVTDYAVAFGTGVKNSIVNFSLRGKNSGSHFHSEYSSGGRTPERIWETRSGIFPYKFIETGFVVYSEKDLTPAYNRDYFDGSIQEEFFTGIKYGIFDIDFNLKRKEHYSNDRDDPVERGYFSSGFFLSERIYFKLRTSAQKSPGSISSLYSGEMKIFFPGNINLSLGYTEIRINGDVPYYAVISPASEHSSLTCFRNTVHGGSINLKYKNGRDSFYARFTLVKTGNRLKGDAESGLTLFF